MRKILLAVAVIILSGCGVKGRPQAPLNPTPIGRGEPTFSESKKSTIKKTIPSLEKSSEASESK